jgi:hypothetical protein
MHAKYHWIIEVELSCMFDCLNKDNDGKKYFPVLELVIF